MLCARGFNVDSLATSMAGVLASLLYVEASKWGLHVFTHVIWNCHTCHCYSFHIWAMSISAGERQQVTCDLGL